MNAHTPGPWMFVPAMVMEDGSVYPPHVIGGARELEICHLSDMTNDAMCESSTDIRSKAANARLIAAAPDLLAMLERIRDDRSWRTNDNALWTDLLAAIAKATRP